MPRIPYFLLCDHCGEEKESAEKLLLLQSVPLQSNRFPLNFWVHSRASGSYSDPAIHNPPSPRRQTAHGGWSREREPLATERRRTTKNQERMKQAVCPRPPQSPRVKTYRAPTAALLPHPSVNAQHPRAGRQRKRHEGTATARWGGSKTPNKSTRAAARGGGRRPPRPATPRPARPPPRQLLTCPPQRCRGTGVLGGVTAARREVSPPNFGAGWAAVLA